jgi:hypothetical protein
MCLSSKTLLSNVRVSNTVVMLCPLLVLPCVFLNLCKWSWICDKRFERVSLMNLRLYQRLTYNVIIFGRIQHNFPLYFQFED